MNLLSSLEFFVAVAEHSSFTHAADHLGVAQPPVSKRIADLEKHLGARLFDRSRRHIELTTAGKGLLPEAVEILRRIENLPKATRPRTDGFTVGVVGSLDPAKLAEVDDQLWVASNHVRFVPEKRSSLEDRIAAGELEAGMVVGEPGEGRPQPSSRIATNLFVEIGVASSRYAQTDGPPAKSARATPVGTKRLPVEQCSMPPRVGLGTLRGLPAGMELSRIASPSEREKIFILPEDSKILDDSTILTPLVQQGIHLRQLEVAESEFAAVAHVYSHGSTLMCSEFQARKNSLPFRRLQPPIFTKCVYAVGSSYFDLLGEMNADSGFERAVAEVLGARTDLRYQPSRSIRSGYSDERLNPVT